MAVFSKRHSLVFAGGLLFGVFIAAAVFSGVKSPGTTAMAADSPSADPASVAHAQAATSGDCGFAPILVAAPQGDGKFPVPMDVPHGEALDVPAFIAVGNDAAAQKRPRDAEVAYITACRIASLVAATDPALLADAKYQLANLYLQALPSGGTVRQAAVKRSQALFSESVSIYASKLGLGSEKTRLAAAGGTDPAPVAAGSASDVIEVPRVLLAERNSPAMMTTAMGAPPAKKHKPKVEEEDAGANEPAPRAEEAVVQPEVREPVKVETLPSPSADDSPPAALQ
jgi:hypothetical protein